jgi:hypothetical protein
MIEKMRDYITFSKDKTCGKYGWVAKHVPPSTLECFKAYMTMNDKQSGDVTPGSMWLQESIGMSGRLANFCDRFGLTKFTATLLRKMFPSDMRNDPDTAKRDEFLAMMGRHGEGMDQHTYTVGKCVIQAQVQKCTTLVIYKRFAEWPVAAVQELKQMNRDQLKARSVDLQKKMGRRANTAASKDDDTETHPPETSPSPSPSPRRSLGREESAEAEEAHDASGD